MQVAYRQLRLSLALHEWLLGESYKDLSTISSPMPSKLSLQLAYIWVNRKADSLIRDGDNLEGMVSIEIDR